MYLSKFAVAGYSSHLHAINNPTAACWLNFVTFVFSLLLLCFFCLLSNHLLYTINMNFRPKAQPKIGWSKSLNVILLIENM